MRPADPASQCSFTGETAAACRMRPPLLRALPTPRPSPQLLVPLPLRPVRWRGWTNPPPRPGTHLWMQTTHTGHKSTKELSIDSTCDTRYGLKKIVLTKFIISQKIKQKETKWCFPHVDQHFFQPKLFVYSYIFVLLLFVILLLWICTVLYSLQACYGRSEIRHVGDSQLTDTHTKSSLGVFAKVFIK